jgi:polyisoprenoid-binding protein YceI
MATRILFSLGALLLSLALPLASAAPQEWLAEGEIAYHARDQAASWRGVAPLASHRALLDPNDLTTLQLSVRLEPARFNSGNGLRDSQARRTVFEVDQFPEALLEATASDATTAVGLTTGVATTVTLQASLTLHGVTRSFPLELSLLLSHDAAGDPVITAVADFVISLESHGMRRPRLLGLVTDDEVRVEVRVVARPLPQPTATTQR